MAAQFCMSCGQPLAPGAQFCGKCGTAVAGAPPGPEAAQPSQGFTPAMAPGANPVGPSGMSSPMSPGGFAPAPAGPPLSSVLGLQNSTQFLLQHLLIGPKHSYRVMDKEKRHLFTVGENVREERQVGWTTVLGHPLGGQMSEMVSWGGVAHPARSYWVLDDNTGNLRGTLTLQLSGKTAMCTLADETGAPSLVVNVTHGPFSISANATSSDGRPMLEARGNLMRHNFSIHDPSGAEVAKIHEEWASLRDSYNLELSGGVDPLSPLVFAIVIDHFKGK